MSVQQRRYLTAAFTMVEVAISIAVIAFALVAILGVLPTGIRVQKDNREDTIVNQDGTFLLEAIRSGSRGLDDLVNYFDTITISNSLKALTVYANDINAPNNIATGERIVGRLSVPKYFFTRDSVVTNYITARVRAINGTALDKDPANKEFAFTYLLSTELVPFNMFPPDLTNYTANGLAPQEMFSRSNNWRRAVNVSLNTYELRLTIQWPYFLRGDKWELGNNRKTFRTLVTGQILFTNGLFFVQPSAFAQVPIRP